MIREGTNIKGSDGGRSGSPGQLVFFGERAILLQPIFQSYLAYAYREYLFG